MNMPARCPVIGPVAPSKARHTAAGSLSNADWWPDQLNLRILKSHAGAPPPLGFDFKYTAAFNELDFQALKNDLQTVMTTSQAWWPADYGHYGPLFIRMAWHSAGTYRTYDGRGGAGAGTQRFAPLNSWPDNTNLDKARRLLWPIKQQYGKKISWADLMILAANVALESMGFKTFGFAGGREDAWEPPEGIYWGPESEWLGDNRYSGKRQLENPLAAVQMGLIYVNPEGPNGTPDPLAAATDIRETFKRMAMNDEETVALIAGGHSFGKSHGAAPADHLRPPPEGASIEEQGLGWKNSFGSGKAGDTISSGLEGAWTSTPTRWSHGYFQNLFQYEWELTKSPAGAWQWTPMETSAQNTVPDAHDPKSSHAPMMFTTDLALRFDPDYELISRRFLENPTVFSDAFAKAWYKLTHRDMGPVTRLLGPEVPEAQLWQDPTPKMADEPIDAHDISSLKQQILDTDTSVADLVYTAWASASTFRGSDKRGGANGARIRLAPQKDWEVNNPVRVARVVATLERIQKNFCTTASGNKEVSLADLIVLGGSAAVEEAAHRAGHELNVMFYPGRTDTTIEMTDIESFRVLEPKTDGFRNHTAKQLDRPVEELLLERADLLTLTARDMTVLIGGLRVLGANSEVDGQENLGVFTKHRETLSNDFFITLLCPDITWQKTSGCENIFEGRNCVTDTVEWTATRADLIFGSNAQLRAICEVYASEDGQQQFLDDFIEAWVKVMNLDRFDLQTIASP
ncbi:catalase/peroxidase HPI [Pirellulales bacterium]|nr:catalase/peroxidase HPI [Pirellulales bacterium]